MRTVHKYPLPLGTTRWELDLAADTALVHVGHQRGRPTLWFELDPKSALVADRHVYEIVATGQPVPERGDHVGSFQTDPGGTDFIFHVYRI